MYKSFNFERLFMARRSFAGGSGLYLNGRSGRFSNECSIESHHVRSECGIRYVDGLRYPQLIFSPLLGIELFAFDIDGAAGATDNAIALEQRRYRKRIRQRILRMPCSARMARRLARM